MCYALYIGADEELPVDTSWELEEFHLRPLASDEDRAVLDKFAKPHVYYAASYQGCGCGWFAGGTPPTLTAKRRAEMRSEQERKTAQCVSALHDLMADTLARHDSVELYLTWEGQQADPRERSLGLALADFSGGYLPLSEGDFATVAAAPHG